ncbi:MAG: glutamine-hydrolyzing GMP synthase, partial [Myxococcota bacterium]
MPPDAHRDRILILDFGGQTTQLIARRIREQQVYCEIHPPTLGAAALRAFAPAGVILSGGPASVLAPGAPKLDPAVLALGVPVLGICYGEQLFAHQLGGLVEKAEEREFGRALLKLEREHPLFGGLPGCERTVWMSHGDRVLRLPPGFEVIATSDGSPFAAVADREQRLVGVQFHPE